MRNIVIWNAYPPIPIRTMDWAAYYEGEEETGHYGWGRTEQEAIEDFLCNVVPDDLDDFTAYLSDFFVAWSTAVKEENEAAELFDSEREFVSRSNYMRRS